MAYSNFNISAIGTPTLEVYLQSIVVGELIKLSQLKTFFFECHICIHIHDITSYLSLHTISAESAHLSNNILYQSINGEHYIGMDTKHLPTSVFIRCRVDIACYIIII